MYKNLSYLFILSIAFVMIACNKTETSTFQNDVEFLKQHMDVVVLKSEDNMSKLVICPELQGRVMTSSSEGDKGYSYGWINYELIASGENNKHMNAFGGEERIWFGPEGGQFSLFFEKDKPFDLESWFTPPPINEEAFTVISHNDTSIVLQKQTLLKNYSDYTFHIDLKRTISLLTRKNIEKTLNISVKDGIEAVGYKSENQVTNTGEQSWVKSTGLISIWMISMFNPSDDVYIFIPYTKGNKDELGEIVNDNYFGEIPSDRLKIDDGVVYFKGDGKERGKIGLSYLRSTSLAGSYDAKNNILTVVTYNKPDTLMPYVNSSWEIQEEPYHGDVINSYNDGPLTPGGDPLGPFYELETSSPALELQPGEDYVHNNFVFHFKGKEENLDVIVNELFGISIQTIKNKFQ